MTEQEWRACTNPTTMLEFMRGKASDRKLRLFACGCVRRAWEVLEGCWRLPIEVAERLADGLVTMEGLEEALQHTRNAFRNRFFPAELEKARIGVAGLAAEMATIPSAYGAAYLVVTPNGMYDPGSGPVGYCFDCSPQEARIWRGKRPSQVAILRDIFGNPFRPVTLTAAWQTPTVLALATATYDNRTLPAGTLDPARLAILADALEEAGCTNADILNHCRQPGPHVRGCWAVDLILGKE